MNLFVRDRPNHEQFEALVMPLLDSMYNFACWLSSDREEAKDLVQETVAKALRGFGSFEPDTNFRAWIFRILRNTFLTSRTGLRVKSTVALEDEQDASTVAVTSQTPETILLGALDQQAVRRAIEELPIPYREVILLCEVEEMSYREIADTLSIPVGTVMSRLSRARDSLREALSGPNRKVARR
jgi:RNA polymerase sigma-70 factor (ECF subfamily)